MSINSTTNAAIGRRPDFEPMGATPHSYEELARASGAMDASQTAPTNSVTTALSVLTTYIPTEVLTMYVAVLAALQDPSNKTMASQWVTFWAFLVATPIVVWLIYSAKVKSAGKELPLSPTKWPLWEMAAAMLAYTAWAIALPNTPFAQLPWYSAPLSGIVVLLASTVLGLLAPIFQSPLKV